MMIWGKAAHQASLLRLAASALGAQPVVNVDSTAYLWPFNLDATALGCKQCTPGRRHIEYVCKVAGCVEIPLPGA